MPVFAQTSPQLDEELNVLVDFDSLVNESSEAVDKELGTPHSMQEPDSLTTQGRRSSRSYHLGSDVLTVVFCSDKAYAFALSPYTPTATDHELLGMGGFEADKLRQATLIEQEVVVADSSDYSGWSIEVIATGHHWEGGGTKRFKWIETHMRGNHWGLLTAQKAGTPCASMRAFEEPHDDETPVWTPR